MRKISEEGTREHKLQEYSKLGALLYRKYKNVKMMLLRIFELCITGSDMQNSKTSEVLQLLIVLYEAWNKPEKANEWRTKLSQAEAVRE